MLVCSRSRSHAHNGSVTAHDMHRPRAHRTRAWIVCVVVLPILCAAGCEYDSDIRAEAHGTPSTALGSAGDHLSWARIYERESPHGPVSARGLNLHSVQLVTSGEYQLTEADRRKWPELAGAADDLREVAVLWDVDPSYPMLIIMLPALPATDDWYISGEDLSVYRRRVQEAMADPRRRPRRSGEELPLVDPSRFLANHGRIRLLMPWRTVLEQCGSPRIGSTRWNLDGYPSHFYYSDSVSGLACMVHFERGLVRAINRDVSE